jgi:hypothetical protein
VKVYVTLSEERVMFAVTGLLMLPLGLMMMVPPDCAFAGCTLKANTDKPRNNKPITRLETILFNSRAFLAHDCGLVGK